ncbi:MAG: hypothetical protein R3185_00445 [Candidatus Thermoplasmatota archaeon]|nr:hypothetical protein [Candidatus Thermoplasmatota archaeon]
MPGYCATCHRESNDALELTELGFGPSHTGLSIQLCQSCLDRREAASWPARSSENQAIQDALNERHAPPQDRYTYLSDQEGVLHLLRLRPQWVDQHAIAGAHDL